MLPKLHKSELVGWLNLLRGFQGLLGEGEVKSQRVRDAWGEIQEYLQGKIMTLTVEDVDIMEKSFFQSWQTETHRYIRLLATDLMFLYSAKESQSQKLVIVNQRLNAVIQLTEKMIEITDLDYFKSKLLDISKI